MPEAETKQTKKRGVSRTCKVRIDKFDNLEGDVFASVVTKPIQDGESAKEVMKEWITQDTFSFTLRANQNFPVTIRLHRKPQRIGRRESKETGRMVEPLEPSTWPLETQRRGSEMCLRIGECVHEQNGAMVNGVPYKCPRSLDLPNGLIKHAKEVWVVREDGPPVVESDLDAAREREIDENKRIDDIAKAKLAQKRGMTYQQVSEVAKPTLGGDTAGIDGTGSRLPQN